MLFLGINADQTCMGSVNLIPIGPTSVVQRSNEMFVRHTVTIATALLEICFKQRSDFLERPLLVLPYACPNVHWLQ